MLSLKPFDLHLLQSPPELSVQADLTLRSPSVFEVQFKWLDPASEIIFADTPNAGRHMGLWQQTCFEVFIQPTTLRGETRVAEKNYFEINLTPQKAWNVFTFQDYREPQPPKELVGACLLQCEIEKTAQSGLLKAQFELQGIELTHVKVSFCAVILNQKTGTTYWSFKHADQKPNFHHFDSFSIERSYFVERFNP